MALLILAILVVTIMFFFLFGGVWFFLEDCLQKTSKKYAWHLTENATMGISFTITTIASFLLVGVIIDEFGPNSKEKEIERRTVIQTCYEEGVKAAKYDLPCESCPYGPLKSRYSISPSEEMEAWMKGWTEESIRKKDADIDTSKK